MTNIGRPFTLPWLKAQGFVGFDTVKQLRTTQCASVTSDPGVYVVIRSAKAAPVWLDVSPGGHFKGRDPTVPTTTLSSRVVKNTPVLYIGKADKLKRRISQYVRFGAGAPIGHWGGRSIWQLADSDELEVAWLIDGQPRLTEADLIEQFIAQFGSMPLANLQR